MLTVDMKGMQVQVVVNTWKNNNWIASTILGPVTINISESIPVITEHPKGGVAEAPEQPKPAKPGEITIVFGRQYLFKVTASGSNIKYQWQISSDNGRTFVDIPYATKDSTGLKVEKENNGKLVRCVVSNEYGSAVSNAARLTVYYQPKFADKISDTTVNAGEKAAFTMSVTEGNPTGVEVTWQVSRDGGETYSDVTEADGTASLSSKTVNGENVWMTTFVTCEATSELNGNVYRCIARNAENDDYVGTWRSDAATLTVNSYTVNYDTDGGSGITSKIMSRTDKVLDGTSPVIKGVENGKTYCEAQTVTIDEKYVDTVTITVNDTEVTLYETGNFVLSPADGKQEIIVTDKAGNTAEMTVTVNYGHTFDKWKPNGDGTHTSECTVDGCTFTETDNCADGDKNHICDYCGKAISNHEDTDKNHICDYCGKIITYHTGGKATCKNKAVHNLCLTGNGEAAFLFLTGRTMRTAK